MKFKSQLNKIAFFVIVLGSITFSNAQVKIGDNPTSINDASLLELESTNKGLLLPRVSLTSTRVWGLSGTPIEGMKVYNTNSAIVGNLTAPRLVTGKGVYYWTSSKWIAVGEVNLPVNVVGVDALACGLASPSSFPGGVIDPVDAANGGVLADENSVYINKCDGTSWSYDASTNQYSTYIAKSGTPFNFFNSTTDAGANKVRTAIRIGNLYSGSSTGKSVGLINSGSTETTIGFFDRSVSPVKFFSIRANTSFRPDFLDILCSGSTALISNNNFMTFSRLTGRVGINNEFPDERLDVWSMNGEESGIRIGQYGIGSFRFTMPANEYKLRLGIANFPIMTFTDQRRLGVRNTEPQGPFHVDASEDNPATGAPSVAQQSNDVIVTFDGRLGVGTTTPTSKLQVVGLPIYVDNAAAISGGLTIGAFYHNGDGVVRVVF